MKNKVIRIVFVAIAVGLFVTEIILTNDRFQDNIIAEKLIPIIPIVLMILAAGISILGKINRFKTA